MTLNFYIALGLGKVIQVSIQIGHFAHLNYGLKPENVVSSYIGILH